MKSSFAHPLARKWESGSGDFLRENVKGRYFFQIYPGLKHSLLNNPLHCVADIGRVDFY
jgi:hypothetical protein